MLVCLEFYINGIVHLLSPFIWLLPLSVMNVIYIHPAHAPTSTVSSTAEGPIVSPFSAVEDLSVFRFDS